MSGSPPHILENPQPGSFQSGIGVISGWVCEANQIEIEFDNGAADRWQAGYGTRRTDTRGTCVGIVTTVLDCCSTGIA